MWYCALYALEAAIHTHTHTHTQTHAGTYMMWYYALQVLEAAIHRERERDSCRHIHDVILCTTGTRSCYTRWRQMVESWGLASDRWTCQDQCILRSGWPSCRVNNPCVCERERVRLCVCVFCCVWMQVREYVYDRWTCKWPVHTWIWLINLQGK